MARLVMLSGLPGSGKSTLGRLLAERTGAEYLRIDVFEQALRDQNGPDFDVGTGGYQQGYELARHHLRAGRDVIADAVNAVEAARQGWRKVAELAAAEIIEIEIVCSDADEVRDRLRTRETGIAGLAPVTIEAVQARLWDANPHCGHRLDTAARDVPDCLADLLQMAGLAA
ncbi:MAG TPA: ATP-binding protein [Hyphomonas sp.]|nr:ATP-binding protein [Hyphomonas sp.]MCB9963065.1 ATP-binding protein [Hyphomonas sp.]MCC0017697.1 ATP-binding protein [Rhodobiaceae bacterium]HPE47561.1 ATP-binding protein [Hyphomonas sp.]